MNATRRHHVRSLVSAGLALLWLALFVAGTIVTAAVLLSDWH